MRWSLTRADVAFMVSTLMPGVTDKEHATDLVQADERFIDTMLNDDRLFQRLMASDDLLLQVSPALLFAVLLRRARQDLEQEAFTLERRQHQKVVLFDTDRVIELLDEAAVRDYLAAMLASFTRIVSVTVPVRIRRGIWRKYRISDIDVESLMHYCAILEETQRYEWYRHIGDACLFLTGMFPEYIEAQHRYPLSRQLRPAARSRVCQSQEDYEAHGQAFYRLAAEHQQAHAEGIAKVLSTLAERFILAEKALGFIAERYLRFAKRRLFELQT